MAQQSAKQCLAPGCKNRTHGRYCQEEHAHLESGWQRHREKQGTSGRGGRPWQRTRKRIFTRDKFRCQECRRQGKLTGVLLHGPADQVGYCDHIVPIEEGGSDDDENLQTLCLVCHTAKTQAESRGEGGGKKP